MSGPALLRLVPLGTNGFYPTFGRQTMCFLVVSPGAAMLLDAGSGVARLSEPARRAELEGVERLEIVLTHYHLDHVIGLSYLPGVLPQRRVRIHAPAPPLVAAGSEALDKLIGPPLFPVPFHRWPTPAEVSPYAGAAVHAGAWTLATRGQKHPGGSVGLRLGDRLAYVTDTVLDLATVAFVRGVDTLLHEVWIDDEDAEREDPGRGGHSAAGPVADLAREAGVRRLIPVHHRPSYDTARLAALARALERRSGCVVELPVEGQPIELA